MAKWREKGYVPDSDEEEDSQQPSVHEPRIGIHEADGRDDEATKATLKSTGAKYGNVMGSDDITILEEENTISGFPTLKTTDEDSDSGIDGQQHNCYEASAEGQLQAKVAAKLIPEPGTQTTATAVWQSSEPVTPNTSRASSPLSDAPSSLPDLPTFLRPQTEQIGASLTTGPRRPIDLPELNLEDGPESIELPNEHQETVKSGRTFRHRSAIQLHPYVIEKEKFNQTWRARGLKPVHILQEEAARTRALEEDSQNFELSDVENGPTSSPPARAIAISVSQSPRLERLSGPDDDDLPDFLALLQGAARNFASIGHKRRKIGPKFKKPPKLPPEEQNFQPITLANVLSDDESLSFDAPSSSLLSGSQTPAGSNQLPEPRIHIPPRATFPGLPTPLTSSEPRKTQSRETIIEEDSDGQSLAGERASHALHVASSSSEDEVNHQLERAQRRIKGVLPASWLKLDLKTQAKQPQQERGHPLSVSPEKDGNQRGVARPVSKNGSKMSSRLASRQEVFVLSDDDNSGSDANLQMESDSPSAEHGALDRDERTSTSHWGEAMEDNSVDALLPTAKRPRLNSQHLRKRQTKISNFGVRRELAAGEPKARPSTQRSLHPRINHQFQKAKSKPRFRPPNLSILDATGRQNTSKNSHPAFVRVATRTARFRNDKGRHSPTCKFLRLATREDTEDVNETIQAWQEGSIPPSLIDGPSALRQPLHPRSANDTAISISNGLPRIPKQAKTVISTGKLARSRPRPTRTKRFQSSLGNIVSWRLPQRRDTQYLDYPSQVPRQVESRRRIGQLQSSLKTSDDWRPAMLESSQIERGNVHPQRPFRKELSTFIASSHGHQIPRPVLDRFLHDEDPLATVQTGQVSKTRRHGLEAKKPGQCKPFRTRKRRPRRLEAAIFQMQESTSPAIVDEMPDGDAPVMIGEKIENNQLRGLGLCGVRYTTTCDVTPLPAGTSFPNKTFLGSGDFKKSLALQDGCDLDNSRGFSLVPCDSKIFRWGTWNEIVSSEMGEVFKRIEQGRQSLTRPDLELDAPTAADAITLQTAVISYFTAHLSFSDPVDRLSFLQRCKGLLSIFLNEYGSPSIITAGSSTNDSTTTMQCGCQVAALGLVLANQLRQISEHSLVPLQLRDEVVALVEISAKQTIFEIGLGSDEFQQYLIRSRRTCTTRLPLQIDRSVIEAFAIAHHILRKADIRQLDILDLMQDTVPSASKDHVIDVGSSERAWQQLFALLPFLELDEQGILDVGRRFKIALGDWNLIKRLIAPVLETYLGNPLSQAPGFNAYCHSLFSRCLHLINGWGWYRCDSIIGIIFDFFAKNGLGHLRNEESHGSPSFLENLSKNPALDAEPEDRCFHLLLKIIGSGIKHMRVLHPRKKIRDLVWRLMPNHGRSHPKEKAVRREDLDALRNHHDLLCTLYWASPFDFRPSLNAIRTLVDLERSHKEACHINIRAWFNLVKFQLSTDEPLDYLAHFVQWHTDFLQQMLRQHGLARTEVEDHVRSAQYVNGLGISKELRESTIAKNQRQVEAVLDDALICLELAIRAARTLEAAGFLLSPALTGALSLFDGSKALASGVVFKALDVLLAYTKKCPIQNQQKAPHGENDDSQDYGDWSAFNGDNALEPELVNQVSAPLLQIIGPLRALVSNCFGADTMPQESLMIKLIDTWVAVSCVLVDDGVKSWDDYLGQFGIDAWQTLRDTEQTRRYAAYFFSSLMEKDVHIYRDNRSSILMRWLSSLVERESLLKFQHKFTSALLNVNSNDPLVANLPFWKSNSADRFSVTAAEFSDRRLLLISCVLSNMRTNLDNAYLDPDTNAAQLKQEYKDFLKHLMTTMKQNYSELGQGSNVRGAYVDFVHRVIEFLQEHTSGICPVDRFFTDSAAFPLPASDPNYVVGKLRNYGLRMPDLKMPKELVMFLQSVSERAAADGLQTYLVKQLHITMSNSSKDAAVKPTLCEFMVKAIVPAYIQMAFENSVGWLLAMPFLKALQTIFEKIHLDLNGCDTDSLESCMSILVAFLDRTRTAMGLLTDKSNYLESASGLKTLAACYRAISALLPTLDYILRLGSHKAQDLNIDHVAFFKSFAKYTHAIIAPLAPIEPPGVDVLGLPNPTRNSQHDEVYNFAIHELQDTLKKNWIRVGDEYFVTRGSSRQQVAVDIGPFEEERDALRLALHEFGESLSTLSGLGGWEEWYEVTMRVQNDVGCDELLF